MMISGPGQIHIEKDDPLGIAVILHWLLSAKSTHQASNNLCLSINSGVILVFKVDLTFKVEQAIANVALAMPPLSSAFCSWP